VTLLGKAREAVVAANRTAFDLLLRSSGDAARYSDQLVPPESVVLSGNVTVTGDYLSMLYLVCHNTLTRHLLIIV
jgi:hypothetical protein